MARAQASCHCKPGQRWQPHEGSTYRRQRGNVRKLVCSRDAACRLSFLLDGDAHRCALATDGDRVGVGAFVRIREVHRPKADAAVLPYLCRRLLRRRSPVRGGNRSRAAKARYLSRDGARKLPISLAEGRHNCGLMRARRDLKLGHMAASAHLILVGTGTDVREVHAPEVRRAVGADLHACVLGHGRAVGLGGYARRARDANDLGNDLSICILGRERALVIARHDRDGIPCSLGVVCARHGYTCRHRCPWHRPAPARRWCRYA